MPDQQKLFYQLTPDFVLDAVESFGWRTTGEYLQLNSYENRVYSVRVESGEGIATSQIIVKFYRPERWSEAAILEEHAFLEELRANGVAAIAPLTRSGADASVVCSGASAYGPLWLLPSSEAPAFTSTAIGIAGLLVIVVALMVHPSVVDLPDRWRRRRT